jgi:hypothetical protein
MNVALVGAGVAMMAAAVAISAVSRRETDPKKRSLMRLPVLIFIAAGAALAISGSNAD